MKRLMALFFLFMCMGSIFAAPFDFPVSLVLLDAGHGGYDPGAVSHWDFAGGQVEEKHITLAITQEVAHILSQRAPELEIILTRTEDVFVSLENRAASAIYAQYSIGTSAIFVSIHVNSSVSAQAAGIEVLTKFPSQRVSFFTGTPPVQTAARYASWTNEELNDLLNAQDARLAKEFETVLAEKFPDMRMRGIKNADVYVLHASRIPTVLIETGFLSSEDDAMKLLDSGWQKEMASAIAEAILSYAGSLKAH